MDHLSYTIALLHRDHLSIEATVGRHMDHLSYTIALLHRDHLSTEATVGRSMDHLSYTQRPQLLGPLSGCYRQVLLYSIYCNY
jgi:hypothetical protein